MPERLGGEKPHEGGILEDAARAVKGPERHAHTRWRGPAPLEIGRMENPYTDSVLRALYEYLTSLSKQ